MDPEDQKYIVLDALRNLIGEDDTETEIVTLEGAPQRRVLSDVAYEVIEKLPESPEKTDLLSRLGFVERSRSDSQLQAKLQQEYWAVRQQRLIALGVLGVFILITLAFVLAVAFQLDGASQLGTAFTTLLGAVTGFYAGRRQGEIGDITSTSVPEEKK